MTALKLDLLTDDELEALTGYMRPREQARVLQRHGIFYVERKDGSLAVTLYAVHNPSYNPSKSTEPRINLDAI
nr:hypothetical protein 1 [Saccharospirillaceae bacterium]